jgi:hypothetical protein
VRLWLRYQRYAALLVLLALATFAAGLWATWSWRWGALSWLLVVPVALRVAGFAVEVVRAYPRKLRATALAWRRIERGSFTPVAVRGWCGDPCWRVVADEVLRKAGLPRAERRRVIADYAAQLRREAGETIVIDHRAGTVTTWSEGQPSVRPLHATLPDGVPTP